MNEITKKLRKEIISVSYKAKAGHIPSAFSILEIIYYLYNNIIDDNNKFLLSKGHGCLALYAVLYQKGFITREQFYSFSEYNSILGGHPDKTKLKQIEISAGSLGHGLPIAVGISLSNKIKKNNNKVFCLVGDGECNEGTTWESLLLADKLQLNNLICIVDNNNSQIRSLPTTSLIKKFGSFGFDVQECDGHNLQQLKKAFSHESNLPKAIICNTVKGYGIPEMEKDMFTWHHGAPNEQQYNKFIDFLDNK